MSMVLRDAGLLFYDDLYICIVSTWKKPLNI